MKILLIPIQSILIITLRLFSKTLLAQSLPDFTELVEQTSPSVVKITTKTSVAYSPSNRDEEILRRFFGEKPEQSPRPRKQRGLGSGFIISEDGYILTNAHVVGNADKISVRLTDGRDFDAQLIGSDPQSDVALIKIDADHLPALSIGDPEELKVGAWVLAIGSPFGFDYSVTAGIVSAKGRSLPGSERFVPFIQTDVAINPGNSGGPLFNLDGQVVGINSQIYSRSGGFMGLSFAIPIDVAMNVADQLKKNGEVKRGWLGVQLDPIFNLDSEIARSMGAKNSFGALVSMVSSQSPADIAGLIAGDIIVKLDNKQVKSMSMLQQMIGSKSPGDIVEIEVIRNKNIKKIKVTLGDLDSLSSLKDNLEERSE